MVPSKSALLLVQIMAWHRTGDNPLSEPMVPSKSALVQVMAWHRTGDKPLSEPPVPSSSKSA